MIERIRIQGYRSLLEFELNLRQVTVVSGKNGVGKSNFYRAIKLVKALAEGRFSQALAGEGGMSSVMWAGAPRSVKKGEKPKRIIIDMEHERYIYHMEVGLIAATPGDPTFFKLDPEVKVETLWMKTGKSKRVMAKRKSTRVEVRNQEGGMEMHEFEMRSTESLLSQIREPEKFPFVAMVRDLMVQWCFFHEFDTSARSPLRYPQVGYWSPSLEDDAGNLASALQTIREKRADGKVGRLFREAFPGMSLEILAKGDRFEVVVGQDELRRNLSATELSDGTLRFLCLLAALMSSGLSEFVVLNEPEMSLNEGVYPVLAELMKEASKKSQLLVVTHAEKLAELLKEDEEVKHVPLAMKEGATVPESHLGSGRVWVFED